MGGDPLTGIVRGLALLKLMDFTLYNLITTALAIGVLIALAAALFSLVAMSVRWKTPHRRRHVIRLLVAGAMLPCLVGIQQGLLWLVFLPALGRQRMAEVNASRAEKLSETSIAQVGDFAPNFSLTTVDGTQFTLPAAGDVVLINFFATWCGPCQMELPHIEQIWSTNRQHEHFRLLVIGREESTDSVRQYRDKKGFSFPIAADPDRAVYSLFAKESIPRTLVVAADGRVVYSKAGFYESDLPELNEVLRQQLNTLK